MDAVSKSKTDTKTFDRRVNLNAGAKVNTGAVINNTAVTTNNNAGKNVAITRTVTTPAVTRNVQGAVQKGKKPGQP